MKIGGKLHTALGIMLAAFLPFSAAAITYAEIMKDKHDKEKGQKR